MFNFNSLFLKYYSVPYSLVSGEIPSMSYAERDAIEKTPGL